MSSTKQTEQSSSFLTRRVALTRLPGALLFLIALCLPPFSYAQNASNSALLQLDGSFFISRKKALSPGFEWAIFRGPDLKMSEETWVTQMRLCVTENGEETWTDITPTTMPAHSIETVFFLDRAHGWMFASDALAEEPDARFYLMSTADGGENWKTQEFRRQPYDLMEDMFPVGISFADINHGWLLWHWHMMNSNRDSLLSTTDAGKTWKRLPDPPGAGPMYFVSGRKGWMICASADQEGIPVDESNALCETHDGGDHWRQVKLRAPDWAAGKETRYSDIKFHSPKIGRLSGVVFNPLDWEHRAALECRTRNGGKTWRCNGSREPPAEDP